VTCWRWCWRCGEEIREFILRERWNGLPVGTRIWLRAYDGFAPCITYDWLRKPNRPWRDDELHSPLFSEVMIKELKAIREDLR
jgi:hypothetical protein